MKRLALLVMATVFVVTHAAEASAQTATEVARKAFASTVLIVLEDAAGQPVSLGSGFFVKDSEIATNLHVVEGASRGYAKVIGQPKKYSIDGVTAADPKRDLAILKLNGAVGKPLALADSDSVQVGDTVYAVGNPQGLEGTFSQGIISSLVTRMSPDPVVITSAFSLRRGSPPGSTPHHVELCFQRVILARTPLEIRNLITPA